ncbi:MAG: hypothetical protein IPJ20_02700 [Flammeovirgaceae bacterium]|jgi:hypothetical protein|nr:hypothetical protein [Flammeovirgaceae bacterium]
MKKSIFLISFLLIAGYASAQISKGTILAGASSNLGFTSVSPDTGDNYSLFDLNLKGGYFVIDNVVAGANIGYHKLDTYSYSTFGIFGRYYYQGKFFGGVGFNINSYENSDSQTSIPFEVGYAAFINNNIAVEPSLNFSIGEDNNTFGLNVGFALYFNRK